MEDSNLVPTGGAVLVQFEKYVRRRLLIYAEGVRQFQPKTFANLRRRRSPIYAEDVC